MWFQYAVLMAVTIAGDARPVLCDRHRDLSGRAGVAVANESAVGLMRDVPEGDAGLWKQIGNRHEGRTDDAKGVLDSVLLQHLYEGFLSGHLHRQISRIWLARPAGAWSARVPLFGPGLVSGRVRLAGAARRGDARGLRGALRNPPAIALADDHAAAVSSASTSATASTAPAMPRSPSWPMQPTRNVSTVVSLPG